MSNTITCRVFHPNPNHLEDARNISIVNTNSGMFLKIKIKIMKSEYLYPEPNHTVIFIRHRHFFFCPWLECPFAVFILLNLGGPVTGRSSTKMNSCNYFQKRDFSATPSNNLPSINISGIDLPVTGMSNVTFLVAFLPVKQAHDKRMLVMKPILIIAAATVLTFAVTTPQGHLPTHSRQVRKRNKTRCRKWADRCKKVVFPAV